MQSPMSQRDREAALAAARDAWSRMPLVIIGFPCHNINLSDFTVNLVQLFEHTQAVARLGVVKADTSILPRSRNMIVHTAQQQRADYVFMVDSDMLIPPDTIIRLMQWDKDVVGGTYVRRAEPFDILGNLKDRNQPFPTEGLVEMESIPTGCLLVKTRVFEMLPKPYFGLGIAPEKELPSMLVGEDILFSHKLTGGMAYGQRWLTSPPGVRELVATDPLEAPRRSRDEALDRLAAWHREEAARLEAMKGQGSLLEEHFPQIWCDAGLSREIVHVGQYKFTINEQEAVSANRAAFEAAMRNPGASIDTQNIGAAPNVGA